MSKSFSDIQNRVYEHTNIYTVLGAVGLYIYHIKLLLEVKQPSANQILEPTTEKSIHHLKFLL